MFSQAVQDYGVPVPEAASFLLLCTGLAALGMALKGRKK